MAVVTHVGGDQGFYESTGWSDGVPLFAGQPALETSTSPYSFATGDIAPAHLLLTMLLGGVFERHPDLRFGVIECGAGWIGPLAERLAMWKQVSSALRTGLSLSPAEYLQRNVRVTPYHFEPVDRYIEVFGLEDVYVFSTDYPHVEGGTTPYDTFAERLAPLGDSVFRKFFVENGRLLFPAT